MGSGPVDVKSVLSIPPVSHLASTTFLGRAFLVLGVFFLRKFTSVRLDSFCKLI